MLEIFDSSKAFFRSFDCKNIFGENKEDSSPFSFLCIFVFYQELTFCFKVKQRKSIDVLFTP